MSIFTKVLPIVIVDSYRKAAHFDMDFALIELSRPVDFEKVE